MEAESLTLSDNTNNTSLDEIEPPPDVSFPKPDYTEIVQNHPLESSEKSENAILKPTFKSVLQAKKRLQAFSSNRPGSLPSSPKKVKLNEDKNDENIKKTPKKHTHDDKAKAVIEEIEELKREEQAYLDRHKESMNRSRTKSKTPDKGRFKKVDKKSRNYRRRSPTPEKVRKTPKKAKKYPKNWREFYEFDSTFDLNKDFELATPLGNHELLRHVLFESPSLPIFPFKMKNANREEKIVPFEYIRYTRSKPIIPYSVNFEVVKQPFLTKKHIWDLLPKDIVANIEALYSNSITYENSESNSKYKKSKAWYPKVWKDSDNECKILEKSVGLSFLQTYTGEEEENETIEEETIKTGEVSKPIETVKTVEIFETVEVGKTAEQRKSLESTKTVEEDKTTENMDVIKISPEKHEKKKKKTKKDQDSTETDEKKKKKHKTKKKQPEENVTEATSKKKKHKKDKKKKEKRNKEKKPKRKKSKEKKKKEKSHVSEEESEKPAVKPTKEQIIEELKEVEEKLAKKKEEKIDKKEESRKRKHSEREDEPKKIKQEKHKGTVVENVETIEHPLKRKLEKAKKYEMEVKEHKHKKDAKKSKIPLEIKDEVKKERRKKSRWSAPNLIKEETLDYQDDKVMEQIRKIEESINIKKEDEKKPLDETKERTPDTDEYHSHWESEDDISSTIPRQTLKHNRSWESDEELFERSHNRNTLQTESYTNLEIPLNIKNFSRRSNWEEKPISVVEELKLLEEERRSLSEERKKLELEKQKILKLQEAHLELEKVTVEEPKEVVRMRSSTPEEAASVKIKKEKNDGDFSIDSLNNSLLSNVSSTESNYPIAALENEYEEFIKAVSSESSTVVTPKKKSERRSSSSSSLSSDSDHKRKKRKKKKKKKKRARECEGLLLGKGNNIFNEFDIPVPSDLPEMVPTPVPVPSPVLPLDTALPLTKPTLLLNTINEITEKPPEQQQEQQHSQQLEPEDGLDLLKPFVFSSIVLPSKKTPLVDNSNLKLNDDSDSADFTDKFVKETEEEKLQESMTAVVEEEPKPSSPKPVPKPSEDVKDVPLPSEIVKCPLPPKVPEQPTKSIKRSHTRSRSRTPERHKERRRSRSRSRERFRRRHSPPRRWSPPSRRRSPSPRRSRRRRSPSITPPRSRGGARKRTPSPRIKRTSPLNSPLDGFKKSEADSTISDVMLPQPEDYNESPPTFGDDRINLVLGLENKNEAPPPPSRPPDQTTYYNSYSNNNYGQYPPPTQYNQYGQMTQKNEFVTPPPPLGSMIYSQPPPPIPKPTKVVQVGNILQVVPSDDIPLPPPPVENKTQKIVQVGNMLQIVPAAVIPTVKPPPPPPPQQIVVHQEIPKPVPTPEKQSAETVMKQRKAEREKRRQERERRRKEKEKKRKEKEKKRQMKLKIKTENMIKRQIQIETEALANEEVEEEEETTDQPVQWPPVPAIASTTPTGKGILLSQGGRKRKSVQFADGVRPGEGTSPSGGEELSSPPPPSRKLPKEKRYKKIKIPKKSKKKKVRVKVVKKVQEEEEEDDDDDNLPPPSPPPGSPPPHIFPSRVKTHTINNVQHYVGTILQSNPNMIQNNPNLAQNSLGPNLMQNNPTGFPFRPPIPVVINRHQPPPGFLPGAAYVPPDVNTLSHPPPFQGVSSHH